MGRPRGDVTKRICWIKRNITCTLNVTQILHAVIISSILTCIYKVNAVFEMVAKTMR